MPILYERLLNEAYQHNVDAFERTMKPRIRGLYGDNVIWINKHITNSTEKACVLAEELGHYHTSTGIILDQSKVENRKQERQARKWAYKKLVPLLKIIEAYKAGIQNRYELAEYLEITETFLLEAIARYKEEYGIYTRLGCYTIYFEPLGVMEIFDN